MPNMARIKPEDATQRVYTQLKNMLIDSINAAEDAHLDTSTAPATPSKSANKRKPDESNETPSPSTPSPKKSRAVAAVDSPVLRAFEGLTASDPMSPTARIRNPSLKAKEAAEAGPARSTRRKPILEILDAAKGDEDATPKAAGRKVAAAKDTVIELSDTESDMPPAPRFAERNVVRKPRIVSPPAPSMIDDEAQDDEASDNAISDDDDDAGSLNDFIVSDSEPLVFDDKSEHSAAGSSGSQAEEGPNDDSSPADLNSNDDAAPAVDPATYIMDSSIIRPELHDPLLEDTYACIPHLERAYFFEPYGYDRSHFNGNDCNITLTSIGEVMSGENFTSLYQGLTFVRRGFYVNLARFPSQNLVNDGKRLAIRDEGPFLTGIMCGLVTASNLFEPVVAGSLNNQYNQKRLTIALFPQEQILDMSRICEGLGLTSNPKGTYSSLGLSFITRPEGKGTVYVSSSGYGLPAPASKGPTKSGLLTYRAAPTTPSTNYGTPHNLSLNYEDLVPIYDGRAETAVEPGDRPFRFTDADFDGLGVWRMFRRNRSEIPLESVVAVGYTAHWFEHSGVRYVNTNIKFAIVLHTPTLVVGLDTPSVPPKMAKIAAGDSKGSDSKTAAGKGGAGKSSTNKGKGKAHDLAIVHVFKMLMAYRVLDVRAKMLGAKSIVPLNTGFVIENDRATMALLNDLPGVLTTSHRVLSTFIHNQSLPEAQIDSVSQASCDPSLRLYNSLRHSIAKESYYAIVSNLTAAAIHLRCLLKTWHRLGGIERPAFVEGLEKAIWHFIFTAASTGCIHTHLADLASYLESTVSMPVVKWINFEPSSDDGHEDNASGPPAIVDPQPDVSQSSAQISAVFTPPFNSRGSMGTPPADDRNPAVESDSSRQPAPLSQSSAEPGTLSSSNSGQSPILSAPGQSDGPVVSSHGSSGGPLVPARSQSDGPVVSAPDQPGTPIASLQEINDNDASIHSGPDEPAPNQADDPMASDQHSEDDTAQALNGVDDKRGGDAGILSAGPSVSGSGQADGHVASAQDTNADDVSIHSDTDDSELTKSDVPMASDQQSEDDTVDDLGELEDNPGAGDPLRRSGRLLGKDKPGALKETGAANWPSGNGKKHKRKRPLAPSPSKPIKSQPPDAPRIFIDLTLEDTAYDNYEVELNLKEETRSFVVHDLELEYTGIPGKVMNISPSFHCQEYLDWFLEIVKESQANLCRKSFVKVIEHSALRTTSVPQLLQYIRDYACILVVNEPHDDPGFTKKFFSEICSLDTVTTVHDMRYPDQGRTRKGSPLDLFRAMDEPVPVALNCLNLLDTSDRFSGCIPWSTDVVAWRETRGRPYCPPLEPFPVSDVRWWLAATPTSLHHWHIDASGMNTIVRVETGGKLWVVGVPKDGKFEDFAKTSMYASDYDLSGVNKDRWNSEMIVLGPGSSLIMRPNLPHAVITPLPTICKGGHFYSTPTLKDSVFGLYHHFAADLTVTNTEHTKASYALLSRILTLLHRDLLEPRDPELDRDYSHIPSLDDWSQVVNLLTFCCYFELYCSTIDWKFTREDRTLFEMTIKNRSMSRAIADHFFRTRALRDPVSGEEVKGIIAMSVVFWKMVAIHAKTLIELESVARKEDLGSGLNNRREEDMEDSGLSEYDKRIQRSNFVKQSVEWCIIDGPAWTTYCLLKPDELHSTFEWCGPKYEIREETSEYAFMFDSGLVYGDTQVAERLNASLQHISDHDRFAVAPPYKRQLDHLPPLKRPREIDSDDDDPSARRSRLQKE
ncbi:hypothetical protein H0H93_005902 [Arthromyces matolae]|nr:hypothetical protein H0H93_005902 [Arthromyces matolae]